MYKPVLALNNLQWLICHKTKSSQSHTEESYILARCHDIIDSKLFMLINYD